jgi:hypothetical protein
MPTPPSRQPALVWGATAATVLTVNIFFFFFFMKYAREPEASRAKLAYAEEPTIPTIATVSARAEAPEAPAMITQKQWLDIQLVVETLTNWKHKAFEEGDSDSAEWVVFDDAVLLRYSFSHPAPSKLEEVRHNAASAACSILNRVKWPSWLKELRLLATEYVHTGGGFKHVTFETKARIAFPSEGLMPCGMKGLYWTQPTDGEAIGPFYEDVPLSVPRDKF